MDREVNAVVVCLWSLGLDEIGMDMAMAMANPEACFATIEFCNLLALLHFVRLSVVRM